MDMALTTLGAGTVTVSDALITIGTVLSGLVVYRQKAKDTQLAARDETIKFLRDQLVHENKVNEVLHEKILQMIEATMNGSNHNAAKDC